jgi:hypothetical protein
MPNKIVKTIAPVAVFDDISGMLAASQTHNQCDFLIFDDSLNQVRKPTTEAECATFLGVARVDIVSGKLKPVYQGTDVDAAVAGGGIPGPIAGVEVKCVVKTGDTVAVGDLVYFDPATSARGITITGTKAIGVAMEGITGAAAGAEIRVHIGHRFPADALKM